LLLLWLFFVLVLLSLPSLSGAEQRSSGDIRASVVKAGIFVLAADSICLLDHTKKKAPR
jgi:hypothetical protein